MISSDKIFIFFNIIKRKTKNSVQFVDKKLEVPTARPSHPLPSSLSTYDDAYDDIPANAAYAGLSRAQCLYSRIASM